MALRGIGVAGLVRAGSGWARSRGTGRRSSAARRRVAVHRRRPGHRAGRRAPL